MNLFDTTLLSGVSLAAITAFVAPVRRVLISSWAIKLAAKTLPAIGDTERIALEAGTVWWEGDLFSGSPDWNKLLKFKVQDLSSEERDFLDGPVTELCAMLDDQEIANYRDLPPKVWNFIKKHKFLGMIIPKKHSGLGFSAAMHSAVVTKIASRSVAAAVTVMVPNSLGPGELLLRYGTKKQQDYYLPRLARGEEIPCFALTEPHAGSDAASGQSFGVVTKGVFKGKTVVGIKLTFNKRYITLAPIATVVGLAFRLYDPEHLLGDVEDIGITCALLPRDTKGLNIGNRHDPMGVPFANGPLWGTDVFVPMDYVIGGQERIGQGWRMLMEALAAGRGISLPSLSVGAAQLSTRAASAYALVREQFGMPIGKFEGVRERLARMAASTYAMDATRRLTCGAVDAGEHPAVASAIAKAYLTEGMRTAVNDGMDIMAGSAICRGSRNILARGYASIPIGITVEGANILTRSLIVFGQGAIRCHPYLQAEVAAISAGNVKAFDRALFGHVSHVTGNIFRSLLLGLSGGHLARIPHRSSVPHHYRTLSRLSAGFAVLADVGLITLGGSLKRKEYLSGRYADAFAGLYMASAVLKRFYDEGEPAALRPLVDWNMAHLAHTIETALDGVLRNLPSRLSAVLVRPLVFPTGRHAQLPDDALQDAVVDALLDVENGVRGALTATIDIPHAQSPGLGKLEKAMQLVLASQDSRKAVQTAMRKGLVPKGPLNSSSLSLAVKAGVITSAQRKTLLDALAAVDDVVQVDFFSPAQYKQLK